ncbi:endoplasmic reticulum resident protein [Anaeramoeba ignava]|uniref:Endoplasmic reticulum resident protein n=1 Tax=Anaeramoeba ignava TaxID=1746090 RepID=A0A9Q0LSS1_ANAIG|nr:endoplasmic reticulum resident protein [Anaeramoeba ignava]
MKEVKIFSLFVFFIVAFVLVLTSNGVINVDWNIHQQFLLRPHTCSVVAFLENDSKTEPHLEKAVQTFKKETDMIFATVFCDQKNSQKLCEKYKIEKYPTYLIFGHTTKENPWEISIETYEELVEQVNRYCFKDRNPEGILGTSFGTIKQLDDLAQIFIENPKIRRELTEKTRNLVIQNAKGHFYLEIMRNLLEDPDFIENEAQRLKKLIDSPDVHPAQSRNFEIKLNILNKFKSNNKE